MAIYIVHKDEKDFPAVFCDCCSFEIEDAEQAHAIWLSSPRHEKGLRFDVGHVHKECEETFQLARPAPKGSLWRWQNLNHHLLMLLPHCGYDEQKGMQAQQMLDDLQF